MSESFSVHQLLLLLYNCWSTVSSFFFSAYINFQWGAIICIFEMKFAFYLQFMYFFSSWKNSVAMCVWVCEYVFCASLPNTFFILTFDFHFYSFSTFFSMHLKSALREGSSVLQVLQVDSVAVWWFWAFSVTTAFFFLPLTKCGAKPEKKKEKIEKGCLQLGWTNISVQQ